MLKDQKVAVGASISGVLGLLSLVVVVRVVDAMRQECGAESNVGDGLQFLIAAPSILVGTTAVTGVLFALTVPLVQREWSVLLAIGMAVLAAAAAVVLGVSSVYTPAANELCPNGIPNWWPFPA